MMPLLRDKTFAQKDLNTERRIFNYLLSRGRIVENTFGIWHQDLEFTILKYILNEIA
jgi:hypothetical protein